MGGFNNKNQKTMKKLFKLITNGLIKLHKKLVKLGAGASYAIKK